MEKEISEFTIKNKVTDVGLRLAIASRVPDEVDIRVDNITENKVKVYLKGDKKSVERCYKYLKKQKLGEAEEYTFSELKPLEASGCMEINTDRFFHKLQCEQLGKFVEVGTKGFGELGNKMEGVGSKMNNGFEGLGDKINGLGNKIDNLGEKLDDLPKKLAEELKPHLK